MNLFRGSAIFLTQLPLLLVLGGRFDLLFGFNRTDSGFALLALLFVSVPLLNLIWLIVEQGITMLAILGLWFGAAARGMPLVALVFLVESLAIDLYIASHARM